MKKDEDSAKSRRVVVIHWKKKPDNPIQVFSNLKNFCASYPGYNYNTLSNYLSKAKMAYENDEVRVERKEIITKVVKQDINSPSRQIAAVVKKGMLKDKTHVFQFTKTTV